ncbi:hypothetical protein Ddye_013238 [Dipteronia dyeriana]|uniref:Uncharacterized protein n=1 Tax=Dipteronia dyeriana TaxID=168575 RepID=A0AAE0CJE6_9ROSI|nr:hypothetical protein Ddye_013238 [Dipteronia dyeriana]
MHEPGVFLGRFLDSISSRWWAFVAVARVGREVAVDGAESGASNSKDQGIGGGPDDTGRRGGEKDRVLAMKVGENLFNFMQPFCSVDGNKLVVLMDILICRDF